MFSALKQLSGKTKIKIIYVLIFVLFNALFQITSPETSLAQSPDGERCACVNPVADGCACLETSTNGGSFPGSLGEVQVICATEELASSFFNIANPICGNNAETLPYCSRASFDSENAFCWGTSFANDPGNNIPANTGMWAHFGGDAYFQGWSGPVKDIWTCSASLYCCGSQGNCSDPPLEYGTCPSSGGPTPGSAAEAACEGVAGALVGIGESRLWFSQARLVHVLSTMGQTMFNPHTLNEMYEDSAFSKTATQQERDDETSGNIDNRGGITARIERHQGIDDSTQIVNSTFNNSSVIVGIKAPPPLDPYYRTYGDRACYIEDTFSNPGDDLIGAKMRGEMLFTKQFTVNAKGRPDENSDYKLTGGENCTDDGGSFQIPYDYQDVYGSSECQYDCCSGGAGAEYCTVHRWTMTGCIENDDDPVDCNTLPYTPYFCATIDEFDYWDEYCCAEEEGCVPPDTVTVSCGTLPEIRLAVGGNANIYNKSPLIESIYDTIIEGEDSLFRRFMPKLTGIFDTEDIPTKTAIGAAASLISFGTAAPGSFNLEYAKGQISAPEMYIPHLGSLYKYWLVDFQNAIRPLGFSKPFTLVEDDQLPILPISGDCSSSPAPNALGTTINAAIARFGSNSAAARVPAGALESIYFIESFGQWNSTSYDCSANYYSALGLMQVTDSAYTWVVPPTQRFNDEHQCSYNQSYMSRCDPVDAIEIAARVLLVKLDLWDFGNFVPLGSITTRAQVYCSSAGYYGSTVPDTATDARADDLGVPPGVSVPCRNDNSQTCDTNYSEIVCFNSGFCTNSNDYPNPRPRAGYCLADYP